MKVVFEVWGESDIIGKGVSDERNGCVYRKEDGKPSGRGSGI